MSSDLLPSDRAVIALQLIATLVEDLKRSHDLIEHHAGLERIQHLTTAVLGTQTPPPAVLILPWHQLPWPHRVLYCASCEPMAMWCRCGALHELYKVDLCDRCNLNGEVIISANEKESA